ncbi:MAG: hypothetical protein IPO98_17650 [Saprospiraceae bacterium]|nr:hypothetical protein [Saprospiraceae bacterium]
MPITIPNMGDSRAQSHDVNEEMCSEALAAKCHVTHIMDEKMIKAINPEIKRNFMASDFNDTKV